ncbi:hypothetical protein BRADI_2g30814v3 [Brachypodium distachyon]|uniref:Uncharacterized protein n=1 Tax=Brachypodium distachyon TaxID=15368 RepID=A0A0Q3J2B6_BRADI|nr:hypothetical protein BRADI_2g30814v3 [Brachypodium distachyon]
MKLVGLDSGVRTVDTSSSCCRGREPVQLQLHQLHFLGLAPRDAQASFAPSRGALPAVMVSVPPGLHTTPFLN